MGDENEQNEDLPQNRSHSSKCQRVGSEKELGETVQVPQSMLGRIIGRQGITIMEIEKASGALFTGCTFSIYWQNVTKGSRGGYPPCCRCLGGYPLKITIQMRKSMGCPMGYLTSHPIPWDIALDFGDLWIVLRRSVF